MLLQSGNLFSKLFLGLTSLFFDVRIDSFHFTAATPADHEEYEPQTHDHDRYNEVYQVKCREESSGLSGPYYIVGAVDEIAWQLIVVVVKRGVSGASCYC